MDGLLYLCCPLDNWQDYGVAVMREKLIELLKTIDRRMIRHYPRYKLFRICKAIGIKPYKWQKEYALAPVIHCIPDLGRGTGKTTALMLRLLMKPPSTAYEAETTLFSDPDFNLRRIGWYTREYKRLSRICDSKGICGYKLPIDGFTTGHPMLDDIERKRS